MGRPHGGGGTGLREVSARDTPHSGRKRGFGAMTTWETPQPGAPRTSHGASCASAETRCAQIWTQEAHASASLGFGDVGQGPDSANCRAGSRRRWQGGAGAAPSGEARGGRPLFGCRRQGGERAGPPTAQLPQERAPLAFARRWKEVKPAVVQGGSFTLEPGFLIPSWPHSPPTSGRTQHPAEALHFSLSRPPAPPAPAPGPGLCPPR